VTRRNVSADGVARLSLSGEELNKAIARWAEFRAAARALARNKVLSPTNARRELTFHGGSDRTAIPKKESRRMLACWRDSWRSGSSKI